MEARLARYCHLQAPRRCFVRTPEAVQSLCSNFTWNAPLPLPMNDIIQEITEARNIELGLGLQLCFLHPSKHKFEHPRFCFERIEYVGQKIQMILQDT
ncbi:unnamed protein product [Brassica oleracea var. botrytis]|uniref:(rape) hypothetical protein n=1 Tax=Brassica napus TaxID=3708 RepID=A0A816NES1_BRANA|nr:hypothetical protein HID58_078805 [Brassica napus]CAF2032732.1 unnamed protein product [Brassica napus]